MRKTLKLIAPALVAAVLAACGGSTTNLSPTPTETVKVEGSAAKGLLRFAKVEMFEIGDSGPSTTALASATTGVDGSYVLSVAPTTKPILLKVSTVAGTTKMLDDSQVVNGEFPEVDAPAGLEIRSVAPSASSGTVKLSANPFTEAATQAAATAVDADGSAIGWSTAAITAGIAFAKELAPEGVDPFTYKATTLKDAPNGSILDQRMTAALAGFSKSAANCTGNGGTTVTAADLLCQLAKLRDLSVISVTASGGLGALPKLAEINTFRTATFTAAAEVLGSTPLGAVAQQVKATKPIDNSFAPPLTSLEELEKWVGAMRAGLNATNKELAKVDQLLNDRYSGVVLKGVDEALKGLNYAELACTFDETFTCEGWTSVASGKYQKAFELRGYGLEVVEMSGSKTDDDVYTLTYKSTTSMESAKTAEANLVFTGSGKQAGTKFTDGDFTIKGTVVSFQAGEPNVTLNFGTNGVNVKLNEVRGQNGIAAQKLAGNGTVTLQGDANQDKLVGTLALEVNSKTVNKTARVNELTSFTLNAVAQVSSATPTEFAKLEVSGSLSPKEYTGFNHDGYAATVKLMLANLTDIQLDVVKSSANKADAAITFSSGGSEAKFAISATQEAGRFCARTALKSDAKLCADTVTLSSQNNVYSAVWDGTSTSIDVFSNQKKVGTINNRGVVEINGDVRSLY